MIGRGRAAFAVLLASCALLLCSCTGCGAAWGMREVLSAALVVCVLCGVLLRSANRLTLEAAGPAPSANFAAGLCFSGLFLVVLGSKLNLVHYYGSDVPYWDQWDIEGGVLPVIMRGAFDPCALFLPHNRHRIFFTRLLNFSLAGLDGQWDPVLEMVVNAVLLASVLTCTGVVFWRLCGRKHPGLFALLSGSVGVLWFSWENTLLGCNSNFYFLLGFSLLSMLLLVLAKPFSSAWFAGAAAGLCAQLSMGSGLLAPAAAALVLGFHCCTKDRTIRESLPGVLALLIVTAALSALLPGESSPGGVSISDPAKFFAAVGNCAAFPFRNWIFAPLVWAPCIILVGKRWRSGEGLSTFERFLLTLGVWVILQAAAIAYSRGSGASRYRDLLAVGPMVNVSILFLLASAGSPPFFGRYRTIVKASAAAFIFCLGLSVLHIQVARGILNRHDSSLLQRETVARYVLTKDAEAFSKAPPDHIPYPSAGPVMRVLDDPQLRSILPPAIGTATLAPGGALARKLCSGNLVFVFIGLGCIVAGLKKAFGQENIPCTPR